MMGKGLFDWPNVGIGYSDEESEDTQRIEENKHCVLQRSMRSSQELLPSDLLVDMWRWGWL